MFIFTALDATPSVDACLLGSPSGHPFSFLLQRCGIQNTTHLKVSRVASRQLRREHDWAAATSTTWFLSCVICLHLLPFVFSCSLIRRTVRAGTERKSYPPRHHTMSLLLAAAKGLLPTLVKASPQLRGRHCRLRESPRWRNSRRSARKYPLNGKKNMLSLTSTTFPFHQLHASPPPPWPFNLLFFPFSSSRPYPDVRLGFFFFLLSGILQRLSLSLPLFESVSAQTIDSFSLSLSSLLDGDPVRSFFILFVFFMLFCLIG